MRRAKSNAFALLLSIMSRKISHGRFLVGDLSSKYLRYEALLTSLMCNVCFRVTIYRSD